jgi:hypothetical protein
MDSPGRGSGLGGGVFAGDVVKAVCSVGHRRPGVLPSHGQRGYMCSEEEDPGT